MDKKDLEKLGLTAEALEKAGLKPDDVFNGIMKVNGLDIEAQKSKVTTLETENAGLKKQIGEANTTIEGFKKLDVDGIKKAADEWKTKAEQAQKDATDQIAGLKFDHALESALAGAKAKNPTAVRALLKVTDLKLGEDGTIIGLKEQLEKVQKENDYLFDTGEKPPKIVTGGNNQTITTDSFMAAMRKGAQLPDQQGK